MRSPKPGAAVRFSRIVVVFALFAVILGCFSWNHPRVRYTVIDPHALSLIRGSSDMSKTLTPSYACAYLTFQGTMYVPDCSQANENQDTPCGTCSFSRSPNVYAKALNTTGGPGITATGGTIDCTQADKDTGTCIVEVCYSFPTGSNCTGSPTSWIGQP